MYVKNILFLTFPLQIKRKFFLQMFESFFINCFIFYIQNPMYRSLSIILKIVFIITDFFTAKYSQYLFPNIQLYSTNAFQPMFCRYEKVLSSEEQRCNIQETSAVAFEVHTHGQLNRIGLIFNKRVAKINFGSV